MLQSGDRETEILLGNKQLLAVFFVGAVLLGVAFVGGYMIGRGSPAKKPVSSPVETAAAGPEPVSPTASTGGETHSVPPDDSASSDAAPPARRSSEDLLGARKRKGARAPAESVEAASPKKDGFTPQEGQEFLQVAAVPHDHALAVAAVLRKKGFRAHAVAKPGDPNLYRVIVGPIRDAGELSSTRDSLRKTGFSQVLIQHYQ